MEARRCDAPAGALLSWADQAERDDEAAVESTVPREANVRERTHEFDRMPRPSGAPEATQTVSEWPANDANNVLKRGARAQRVSHGPSGPWHEVRGQKQRFGAMQSRKPAQLAPAKPPGCGYDASSRLQCPQMRRPASHPPLGSRGSDPARASTAKPAKTRAPTDAAPSRTTSKPPPARSA